MKERPILFNGDMVRAILDGSKTQTRRVIKTMNNNRLEVKVGGKWRQIHAADPNLPCPYGQPGDRLYVRETWGAWPHMMGGFQEGTLRYRADGEYQNEHNAWRWRPSIHMPRWASRITLEIVSVRVERLNEISEQDAGDEGFDYLRGDGRSDISGDVQQRWFRSLWESINGAGSWQQNPWVWVVEFKVVQP